jgi:autotransporter-associated beta strand protein
LEDRTVPATLVWVGDVNGSWGANVGGNTNWRNATTSTDNVLPQNGDDLTFPTGAGNRTNTNNLNNLVVNSIFVGGTDYVIGGNAITLTSLSDSSLLGSNVVNLPITGPISVAVNIASTHLTLGGVISGPGSLIKNGAGFLRLSGASPNTYAGETTVNDGTLELNKSANVLAVPGDLTINSGGTARLILGDQIVDTSAVTVNTGGTLDLGGAIDTISLLSVIGGSVTLGNGGLTAGPVTMTGGSITSGTLVLHGNLGTSVASMPATISGTINLSGTHNFAVADGGADPDLNISAIITNGGLNKIGAGTLQLGGSSANTYTGPTTVSAGTLVLNKTGGASAVPGNLTINSTGTVRELSSNQIADSSTVTVSTFPSTFDLNGQTDTIGQLTLGGGNVTIGAGTLTAGPVTMTGGGISSSGVGKLVLQADVTVNIVSAGPAISGNLDLGGATRTFDVSGSTNVLQLFALVSGTGGAGLTKTGTSELEFTGSNSNTYTGPTAVNAGTLALGNPAGNSVPGNLIINNGGTVREAGSNQIADTAAITINAGGTFNLNGVPETAGPLTVAGGTLMCTAPTASRLTAGNTSFNSTSTLAMKVVDAANSDRITANGTVAVGGNLQLTAPSAIAVGTAITLIENDGADPVTGTFSLLPQGATFFAGGQLFAISYAGGTGNDVVVTRTGGPTVLGTQVNDGSAQRSRVTSLSVIFSAQVTFSGAVASAFTLTRTGGGAVAFQASTSVVNGVTVVTLNGFTGSDTEFGSLKDGRYTLTALANQITQSGFTLDGNRDGTAGDNYTFGEQQGLFRFYGDINGDRHVDIADFGQFSSTFNLSTGQTGFIPAFDFNNDGHIDIADFGQFSIRFFTPLP